MFLGLQWYWWLVIWEFIVYHNGMYLLSTILA